MCIPRQTLSFGVVGDSLCSTRRDTVAGVGLQALQQSSYGGRAALAATSRLHQQSPRLQGSIFHPLTDPELGLTGPCAKLYSMSGNLPHLLSIAHAPRTSIQARPHVLGWAIRDGWSRPLRWVPSRGSRAGFSALGRRAERQRIQEEACTRERGLITWLLPGTRTTSAESISGTRRVTRRGSGSRLPGDK